MYTTHLTLIIPALISFIFTIVGVFFVKYYMVDSGIISVDHYKKGKPILPSSGGIAVAFGFTLGLLTYVFCNSFTMYCAAASMKDLFAAALSIIIITFIGFLDDVNVQRDMSKSTGMMDRRKGLRQWQKPLLTFVGAAPLVAANAGVAIVTLPFVGTLSLGLIYPLIVLPLAIVFAANAFNLLGGFDGLSSGTGLVAVLGLFVYSVLFGTYNGAVLSAVLLAAVAAFFIFNKYPASVHPGDSFTYCVGVAMLAIMVIGNAEAFGLIIFIPWIIEFLLHFRGKFGTTDLGKPRRDGTFEAPYGKRIYSWTHIFMNLRRCREWEVSLYMWIVELAFVAIGLAWAASLL